MYQSTFLNEHGDITITWDDSTVDDVRMMIQEKMDKGYTFFLVEKKFGVIPVQRELKDTKDIKQRGKVLMKDKEVQKLFTEGKVHIAGSNVIQLPTARTTGVASSAQQAATSNTIATRPAVGG